jgi:hypothetical protein
MFGPDQTKLPDDHLVDASDSGWRKFALVFITLGLLAWGYWVAQYSPIFLGLYPTFMGGILAAAGLYMGANIADKVQGGIINLKAYPLSNGDVPPTTPGPTNVPPPTTP